MARPGGFEPPTLGFVVRFKLPPHSPPLVDFKGFSGIRGKRFYPLLLISISCLLHIYCTLLLLAMPVSACAADDWFSWDKTNTILQVPMTLTMTVDMMPTLSIDYYSGSPTDPGAYEVNPILGRHPSDSEIVTYFVGMLATRILVTWVLPPRWSHVFQGMFIVHDVGIIVHNRILGLRISF